MIRGALRVSSLAAMQSASVNQSGASDVRWLASKPGIVQIEIARQYIDAAIVNRETYWCGWNAARLRACIDREAGAQAVVIERSAKRARSRRRSTVVEVVMRVSLVVMIVCGDRELQLARRGQPMM